MPKKRSKYLRCGALRLAQNGTYPLYLFSLTGEELLGIADISRVSRTDAGKLLGYQRPAVRKHIKDIANYLDSENVLFPNSIILSLSTQTRFVAKRGRHAGDHRVTSGVLEIPVPRNGAAKPAWIVDGQQRALALSISKRQNMPVPVNAFIGDEVALQREQFLRVNNSKPLPRGLITELLPEITGPLPERLAASQVPSALCNLLNQRKESPFRGLIRRTSMVGSARKRAVVADTSIIHMLRESLNSPSGCLFPFRNIASGETDMEGIWRVLEVYWTAVRDTFPEAWGRPPEKSRLMHGAGIRAMGRLMDRIMARINANERGAVKKVERELRPFARLCHWTSGEWDALGGMQWKEIENVPKHISLLSNYLVRAYIEQAGSHG